MNWKEIACTWQQQKTWILNQKISEEVKGGETYFSIKAKMIKSWNLTGSCKHGKWKSDEKCSYCNKDDTKKRWKHYVNCEYFEKKFEHLFKGLKNLLKDDEKWIDKQLLWKRKRKIAFLNKNLLQYFWRNCVINKFLPNQTQHRDQLLKLMTATIEDNTLPVFYDSNKLKAGKCFEKLQVNEKWTLDAFLFSP